MIRQPDALPIPATWRVFVGMLTDSRSFLAPPATNISAGFSAT